MLFRSEKIEYATMRNRRDTSTMQEQMPKHYFVSNEPHCIRLSNRIGLVDGIKDPKKVEMALWKIIPPEEGNELCHRLVNHGRDVCTARTKPYCDKCCLNDICAKNGLDQ